MHFLYVTVNGRVENTAKTKKNIQRNYEKNRKKKNIGQCWMIWLYLSLSP